MKKNIIDFVKNNRLVYDIYYYLFSFVLRMAGYMIRADQKEILFVCYGGRKYGDNVRPVYLEMMHDERFVEWSFVWAFREPGKFQLPASDHRTKKIKIDSLAFFYHALRAKCWVTNVTVQRGLNFKNKGTVYINTWHGAPVKCIRSFVSKGFNVKKPEEFDAVFAQGVYDKKILPRAFQINRDVVKNTGYPRNDILFTSGKRLNRKVRDKYDISDDTRIVLYAPTYRDFEKDKKGGFIFTSKLSPDLFREMLGCSYRLLVRAHGAIEQSIEESPGRTSCFIDVSDYPDVEDLLAAADILVTDYSAIVFDYALLSKPVLLYMYDLERYTKERGLLVDAEEFFPFQICRREDELYEAVKNLDYDKESEITKRFCDDNGMNRMGSSKRAVDEIYRLIRAKGYD